MSDAIVVLQALPSPGGDRRIARERGACVLALSPEIAAQAAAGGLHADFPQSLREDHLIYPADERAGRWAAEFLHLSRGSAGPAMYRGIDLELMIEGRLKFYFFRRLALFFTKLETLLDSERPERLLLAADDRLFIALARDAAGRRGIRFEIVPARRAGAVRDREAIRRRHALRYAALFAVDLAQAFSPWKPPRLEGTEGVVVLFAESYRHMEIAAPVFQELARRGRFSVLVAHRRGPMSRPEGFAAAYAPLDHYLSPGGFLAMIASARRWDAGRPSGAQIAAAANDLEWRAVAGDARREVVQAALPFVTGLIERVRLIVSTHHADVGITLTEMGAFGQTIARAGRLFGMKTINMEHGLKTHLPMVEAVISDRIAAFGEQSAEVLVRQGADPNAIVLTGAPRYDPLFRREGFPPREDFLRSAGLDPSCRLVVFASYPLGISATHSGEHKEALIAALADAVASLPGAALVVKLHPLETDTIAARLLAGRPEGRFRALGDADGPLYPLLDASEVVSTFTSTTALEAAILGRPILVVNLSGMPDTTPYTREGIALYADRAEKFAPALRRLLDDDALKAQLAEARKTFVRRYAFRDDGRAAGRVADLIAAMVAENRRGR